MNTVFTPTTPLPLLWQHHTLISITQHQGSNIVLHGNTVSNNTGTRSIIDIEIRDLSYVEVSENEFEGNAGMVEDGANVLRMSKTEASVASGSSEAKCGGFAVVENRFRGNFGCMKSAGAVVISCNDEAYKNSVIQPSYLSTIAGKANYWKYMRGLEFMQQPTALSTAIPTSTINLVTTSSGLVFNTLEILFSSNIFTANQVGWPSLISLFNCHLCLLAFRDLIFTENIDITPAEFNLHSPLSLTFTY